MIKRDFFITEEQRDAGEAGFTLSDLSNAVQLFTFMQGDEAPSIAAIARTFKCAPALIAEAVRDHHWMALEDAEGRLIDGFCERSGRHSIPTAIDDYERVFIYHEGE